MLYLSINLINFLIMKNEKSNILIPIDFNEPSLKALEAGILLAKENGEDIIILSIIETFGFFNDLFGSGDQLIKITNHAKDKLNELAETVTEKHPNIKVFTRVEGGKVYKKINEVAKEIKPRIIILGETCIEKEQEKNLSSTVYQVTLTSPFPVLTIKEDANQTPKKIVVPLDLTTETSKQIFSAIVYGQRYNAEVHLVSALIGGIAVEQSRIYKKMENALLTLKENDIKCDSHIFERSDVPPYLRVLEYSEQIEGDMILIMTHQEGYTYDNYIGAFAHHIINDSKVPVLSLTSSATDETYTKFLTSIIDPAHIFTKK